MNKTYSYCKSTPTDYVTPNSYPNEKFPSSYCIHPFASNWDLSMRYTNYSNDEDNDINNLVASLNQRGYIVQEGSISYIDILKLCSDGGIESALGNNVGAPYAICMLPPAPNQDPSEGQYPPIGYSPNDHNNYPANINYIAPGVNSKLRPDEAVVLIGRTPPPALYYCFRSYIGFVENKQGKDYSEYITAGNDDVGLYHMIFTSLGD